MNKPTVTQSPKKRPARKQSAIINPAPVTGFSGQDCLAQDGTLDARDQAGEEYARRQMPRHAKRLGQYFTPDPLCDLMLALSVQSGDDRILDAGCGTGRFLLRAADGLKYLSENSQPGESSLIPASFDFAHLHGVEIDPQAATLCAEQLNVLAKQWNRPPSAHVRCGDFLEDLPSAFQSMDVVIANPPYVRHETLMSRQGKTVCLNRLRLAYQSYLGQHPEQAGLFNHTLDLYLLFLLRAALLLKPGGRLAFVMSNSWLQSTQAEAVMRFLDHHFNILCLLESAVEHWFEAVAINPVILVLQKKAHRHDLDNSRPVRLVRLQQPLKELLLDQDWATTRAVAEAIGSGRAVAGLIQREVGQADFCSGEGALRQKGLFYLRASDRMRALRQKASLWRPLSDFGTIRYPLKTGINRFFYVDRQTIEAFGIEPEYCVPVLKSAREVTHLDVAGGQARWFLFACGESVEELRARQKTGALHYIQWGETQMSLPRQKREQPVPWPEVASVQGRRYWYQVLPPGPADLLCGRFFDRRYFFPAVNSADPIIEDQTFYGFTSVSSVHHGEANPQLIAALLNTTVSYLWVELQGRTNLGEGVLQYARRDMAAHPIPDPALYSALRRAEILSCMAALKSRAILPISQELTMPDRQALDEAVLSPLGVSGEEIYEALLVRLDERLSLAKSRRRTKIDSGA